MTESIEDMLIRHEGAVIQNGMHVVYPDNLTYLTLGYGRLVDRRKGGGITDDEARYLLRNDIQKSVSEAKTFPWYESLNNPRKQVIINMIFNMGLPTFSRFTKTIAAIAAGDYAEASREMMHSKWAVQVGDRAVELSTIMYTGEME